MIGDYFYVFVLNQERAIYTYATICPFRIGHSTHFNEIN